MAATILRPEPSLDIVGGSAGVRITSGDVGLDALAIPYGTATVAVPLTPDTDLDDFDPRQDRRIVLHGDDGFGGTRVFDLGLRSRTVDYLAKTVSLSLATDETLLTDYATLVEDFAAFTHKTSLRAVVNYVLGKVGASLAGAPAVDADVTPYSDQTNVVTNPSAIVDVTGWGLNGIGSLVRQTAVTAVANTAKTALRINGVATGNNSFIEWTVLNPPAGPMRFHARQINGSTALVGAQHPDYLRMAVGITNNAGGSLTWTKSPNGPTTANAVTDHNVTVTVPPQTNQIRIRLYYGVTLAAVLYWADVMATEYAGDPTDLAYWDGSTPDTAVYLYDWQGTVGASSSIRTALEDRPPEMLIWRPGVTAWDFLSPMLTQAGYRLFCDEARIWRMIDPGTYAVPGIVTVSPGNTVDGSDIISREDADVFAVGAVVRYAWTDSRGVARTAYDVAGSPSRVAVQDLARPYPGPGAAANILARRAGTGRTQDVSVVQQWTATPGMEAQLSLPDAPVQHGKVIAITWSFDEPTMRVTTAGLLDIPAGSWVSTPSSETWPDPPNPLSWSAWT